MRRLFLQLRACYNMKHAAKRIKTTNPQIFSLIAKQSGKSDYNISYQLLIRLWICIMDMYYFTYRSVWKFYSINHMTNRCIFLFDYMMGIKFNVFFWTFDRNMNIHVNLQIEVIEIYPLYIALYSFKKVKWILWIIYITF